MASYLFITYGEPGWRGVQMRAVRIAAYLPKEQVLFWELYDTSFITDQGYAVEQKSSGMVSPDNIVFPKGCDTIVFADLPTNELFQYSVYSAARTQGKKVVVCDQLYRSGQLTETVYRRVAEQSDLLLLNALSYLNGEGNDYVRILPPQVEVVVSPTVRADVRSALSIPEDAVLVFASGYNAETYHKVVESAKKYTQVRFLVSGAPEGSEQPPGNMTVVPFDAVKYYDYIAASDVVFLKFGFLQILEAVAFHKPTVVMGEAGYLLQNTLVVDKPLRDVLRLTETGESDPTHVERLLTDPTYRMAVAQEASKLHDGSTHGAQKAAELITGCAKRTIASLPKKLVIVVNDEVSKHQAWIEAQENCYPVVLIASVGTESNIIKRVPNEVVDMPVRSLQATKTNEVLPHSFREVFVLSSRKYDGVTDIDVWYEAWVNHLTTLMGEADEVHVTTAARTLLEPLLLKLAKEKIHSL
jgi:hypothetical protein